MDFPYLVVGQDSLAAVVQAGWPAAWMRDGMPLLQYSRGSFLGALARISQARPGAPPVYVAHTNEASMAEAMKSMALEGHGVVWLPRSLVASDIAAGRLQVVAPELRMEIRPYRNASRTRALSAGYGQRRNSKHQIMQIRNNSSRIGIGHSRYCGIDLPISGIGPEPSNSRPESSDHFCIAPAFVGKAHMPEDST